MFHRHARLALPVTLLLVVCAMARDRPAKAPALPEGFVDLGETIASLALDIRYHGANNFLGHRVDGYVNPRGVATRALAERLSKVQQALAPRGLGLKVFDAYRPQRAVDQFVRWANDPSDTRTRRAHYPRVPKTKLIPSGYIADRSGHSRGSAVDVTLIRLRDGGELDMGSPFDLFDPRSHTDFTDLSGLQQANRRLLRATMEIHGFAPYGAEWWHFSLQDEPYPNTYFDFPIR